MIPRIGRAFRKLQWERVRGGAGRAARVLTVPTANGILSFSNMDLHNARALYVQRAWEIDLITRSMDYLKREGWIGTPSTDVMIDVGANIGMICIAMLRRGHFSRALAFEPGPENFAFLERNIHQNGMADRIHAFQCALSDSSGEVEIELSESNYGDHRVRSVDVQAPALMDEEGRAVVRVPARTLDETLASPGLVDRNRIGLVWVDTQGHEGQFFRGARATIGLGMPVLSEFWPYGILRSGLGRDGYAETVRSMFTHFVVVDAEGGKMERHNAADIATLFDANPRPEQYLEVIYFSRVSPIRG